jgi:hypothetical protein
MRDLNRGVWPAGVTEKADATHTIVVTTLTRTRA